MFTASDLSQLAAHGVSEEQALKGMKAFKEGFGELEIVAPASVKNGIMVLSKEEQELCIETYQQYLASGEHKVAKFVPASGAATRMFKDLYAYLETGEENNVVREFLSQPEKFAFYPYIQGKEGREAVDCLLNEHHYGQLPKGLLLFHNYRDGARTPAVEHLVEGALTGATHIHFTVSHEHLPLFRQHIAEHMQYVEKKYKSELSISFSEQMPSTDTLAANPDGTPFRNPDGTLLFRPGGHGALLWNLNQMDADMVFIKNIDNVVPDRHKKDTIRWKKILAGVLVAEQERVYARLRSEQISDEERELLSRPIRVCGVVKNTGEPGGGPFLVRDADGRITNQILESSQIHDAALMAKSTHFNPVDLVCSLKDEQGRKYNLMDYVDEKTGFISHKSKDGKELLALELPGLWNGAMSKWNTIFVQVPISTFSPVKMVTDLLRPEHQ